MSSGLYAGQKMAIAHLILNHFLSCLESVFLFRKQYEP